MESPLLSTPTTHIGSGQEEEGCKLRHLQVSYECFTAFLSEYIEHVPEPPQPHHKSAVVVVEGD